VGADIGDYEEWFLRKSSNGFFIVKVSNSVCESGIMSVNPPILGGWLRLIYFIIVFTFLEKNEVSF